MMPVDGKPMLHDIKAEVKRACESILPAIVEATTQMIARFDPEFQAKIRKNIVLAGGGSLIGGLREYLQAALKEYGSSQVTCVKDPLFAGSDGALKLAQEMPAPTGRSSDAARPGTRRRVALLALAVLGAPACKPSSLTPFGIGTRGPEDAGSINGTVVRASTAPAAASRSTSAATPSRPG